MATTTPNFGWTVPTSTDLVKDGATAIETLGDGIDASFVDLKGGTTGQVLSKASNTDLDYVWIANDTGDITGVTAGTGISGGGTSGTVTITNSMATTIDAKGDLIAGTGADAFARLAIGTDGQVLTADAAEATGIKWATATSGGMTLISTTSLTGASVTLSSIPSSYKNLQLVIRGYKDNDNGNGAWIRMNADSTSNRHVPIGTFGEVFNGSWNNTRWDLGQNQTNTTATSLYVVTLYDYANSTTFKMADIRSIAQHYSTTTNYNSYIKVGAYNQTTAISSLQIGPTGGTSIAGGTAYLYGVS